ncbi:MAG: cobalamin biosynthesis protein [Pseudomonadota bacterium]
MKVAGFGFRKGAGVDSLIAALEAAGGREGVTLVATVVDKADATAFQALAERLALPINAVPGEALPLAAVATQSEKSKAMYGTGSLSEAVALIAAGPNARLLSARAISPDTMATCAIAEVGQ